MRYLLVNIWVLTSGAVWAASPVAITEVMANPKGTESGPGSPGDRNEFVELYNLSEDTVDLLDWRLTDLDATDHIKSWEDSTLLEKYPDVIINSTLLPPGGFALILDPEYTSTDTVGGYYQPYEIPDSTLILTVGNTTLGDGLQNNDPLLLYDPDSTFISCFGTPDDPEDEFPSDAGDGRSWERIEPELLDLEENWQRCLDPAGCTPGRETSTGIREGNLVSGEGPILSLYPNPCCRPGQARFFIPVAGAVELRLYSPLGGKVRTLIEGPLPSGWHKIPLSFGDPLPAGVYLLELWTDGGRTTEKLIFLR